MDRFEKYRSKSRAKDKDIAQDDPEQFKTILETMSDEDAKKFKPILQGLEEKQLEDIVEQKMKRVRLEETLRKDPEAATPLIFRTLKPKVPKGFACRLVKDYNKRAYEVYYHNATPKPSASYSFLKKRPEQFALYEAVRWLWEQHGKHLELPPDQKFPKDMPGPDQIDKVREEAAEHEADFKATLKATLRDSFIGSEKSAEAEGTGSYFQNLLSFLLDSMKHIRLFGFKLEAMEETCI